MFNKFCIKFLPVYFRIAKYTLAIWSAPIRYRTSKNLPARNDSAWKALRITIRNKMDRPIFVLKQGTI